MLCQNCSKREATTHIKRVVNGEATEAHLCAECAKKLGYDGFFDDFSLSIPNIFASFFQDSAFALAGAKNERYCSFSGQYLPLAEEWSSKGCRVLLLALYDGKLSDETLDAEIMPLSLILLSNKIRPEAPQTFA